MKLTIDTDIERLAAKIKGLNKELLDESDKETEKLLRKRIARLKSELDFLINEYQRVEGTREGVNAQPLAQKIAEEQALGKSRAVVYGDDFHTTFESPTYKAALVNGGNNYAMRVRNSNIHPDSTYEDFRDSFMATLTEKVFAIQDGSTGSYRYYIIEPGSPLLEEVLEGVKIFCSSFTDTAGEGRDDGDPLQDIGVRAGREKFARDKAKGHTEFTLKEDAIRAIKEKGTDITDIVLNTQHGEYEDAYSYSRSIKTNSPAMKSVQERAAEAMEGQVTQEADALAKTNQAIKNMNVKKSKNENSIEYVIQTLIDEKEFVSGEVVQAVKREALVWAKEAEGELRQAIEQAIDKAIKELKGA